MATKLVVHLAFLSAGAPLSRLYQGFLSLNSGCMQDGEALFALAKAFLEC